MKQTTITLLALYLYALLSSGTTSKRDEDLDWVRSLVELVEFDYEDHCAQRAIASWSALSGGAKELLLKIERDKGYGIFSQSQTTDIQRGIPEYSILENDGIIKRKVELLLKPGDTLLNTEQWIRLVTFGDQALHKLRFSTDYDCGTNINCTLRELHNSLAKQLDEKTMFRIKQSWEKKLPDMNVYLNEILPLSLNASMKNGFDSVEAYWDFLTEYESGILKARELWENIKPLYLKLQDYVTLKLKGADSVGKPIPVHFLRSLEGDDWSNLIENLLPKHPDVYEKIYTNIHLRELGGFKAFKEAENLIKEINLGKLHADVWKESLFNGTCPTIIIDYCKSNKIKFVTCKDVSIGNFLDAHETVMKIKYKQTVALHSNNTYILREPNRYSAIYEAIPGFLSLLALNPHALDRSGLYPIGRFNFNPNHHRLVLQLITALKDLPKLNFYLAVDEWRLKVLTGEIPHSKSAASWAEFRRNFSLIDPSDNDILGDPYVVFNKPYIGKFMGLILKYQIYQSFAEELPIDESDLVKHVAENNGRIFDTMQQGYDVMWPDMVNDLLAKREYGLEYTGITDYYTLLEEYLSKQLNSPSDTNDDFDYVDPGPDEPIETVVDDTDPELNNIPSPVETNKLDVNKPGTHEDILETNIIDTSEHSNVKFGTEKSAIGVLEIKNPVANGDQNENINKKEASYSTYWWIGIGVALAIIVILIAIIVKKRHNHRKELEKQRRQNSRA